MWIERIWQWRYYQSLLTYFIIHKQCQVMLNTYLKYLGESGRFASMVKNFRKRKFDQIERDKRKEEIEDLNIKVKGYSDQIDSLKREIIEWKRGMRRTRIMLINFTNCSTSESLMSMGIYVRRKTNKFTLKLFWNFCSFVGITRKINILVIWFEWQIWLENKCECW